MSGTNLGRQNILHGKDINLFVYAKGCPDLGAYQGRTFDFQQLVDSASGLSDSLESHITSCATSNDIYF